MNDKEKTTLARKHEQIAETFHRGRTRGVKSEQAIKESGLDAYSPLPAILLGVYVNGAQQMSFDEGFTRSDYADPKEAHLIPTLKDH